MQSTIKDVAARAGVCIATVSKVINGSNSISEPTKKKVQAVIEELHYVPNYRAASLAKKSRKSILYIYDALPFEAFQTPHTYNLLQGLLKGLTQLGYNLSILNIEDVENPLLSIQNAVNQRAYDGIVVHSSACRKEVLEYLENLQFPYLIIGKQKKTNWVDTNHELAGRKGAHFLIERGYRRFAFIGRPVDDQVSSLRLMGIKEELQERELSLPDERIALVDPLPVDIANATEKLLSLTDKPDVIIAEDNLIALTVSETLSAHKIKVPNDISYLTFDVFPYSKILHPAATVVDINVSQLGEDAAGMIVDLINRPSLRIESFVTMPTIVVGESTR